MRYPYLVVSKYLALEPYVPKMAATSNATTLPRNPGVYRYLRGDGVVANILTMAEKGSGYRQVCSICQKKINSNIQAYAHIKTHGDFWLVLGNKITPWTSPSSTLKKLPKSCRCPLTPTIQVLYLSGNIALTNSWLCMWCIVVVSLFVYEYKTKT